MWAIGVILGLATTAAQSPAPLTGQLRSHVQDGRFQVVTSLRGLPLGVRQELQTLIGAADLDIAEPGAAFQATTASGGRSTLPIRRLVAAGCSYDYCLVYYERGGAARTARVALFHWTPAATTLEWGATAPADLKTFDDVRRAVLSGAVKETPEPW